MLKRLWQYCNKIFKLNEALQQLKSQKFTKKNNEPFLTAILLIAMFMRLRSFNALKLSFQNNSQRWRKLLDGKAPPSISTLERGIEKSDIDTLARINRENNHKLHRNKAFNINDASHGLMVAAVDGHETFSSERRCCPQCLTRRKKIKIERNGKVEEKEVIEYYHKYVVCQLTLCSVPVIIDLEPLKPGEGELTTAKRLIKRILKEQPRRVDVFCFDALYLDASLLNSLDKANKFWVVVIKQQNREAYQEIDRLLPLTKPQKIKIGKKDVTLWDLHDLVGWNNLDKCFRAVVSEEKEWEWVLKPNKRKEKELKTTSWRWLTNLPPVYKATVVYKFGHGRWNVENRGFHDLATNCRLDHPFHHHPTALLAMIWIISIAFNLSYAFFQRNLKPQLRIRIQTRQQMAEEIRSTIKTLDEPLFRQQPP